jgi:hypothetical protein
MRPSLLRLTAAAGATAAVLALPVTASAADAVYGGATSAEDPIVVKADSAATVLRSIVISWRAPCSDGAGYPGGGVLTPVKPTAGFAPGSDELLISRNAKGRFKGTRLGAADLGPAVSATVVEIEGKLSAARASGTLSATVKISDKTTGAAIMSCDTGRLRWVATRAPGIVYGGATSQGEPLVVRLNASRKRVNDVRLTWRAPCSPSGGFFRIADHWGNFPVKGTGSFGTPFTQEFAMDAGGKRRFDAAIAGRVGRTSAKGTVQVKIAETDVNGVAADSCDTGAVTWKAATG